MPVATAPETLDLIRQLAADGYTARQIGSKIGKTESAIQHVFHKHKIPNRGRGHFVTPRQPVHKFDSAVAIEMYESGLTYSEIAEAFGIRSKKAGEVIRRRLVKLGVHSRVGKADGQRNNFWKGGVAASNQLARSRARYHCYRTVVAFLGVLLPEGWVIHHLDENPANNSLSNLCLFPSETLHATHHSRLLDCQFAGDSMDAIRLALEIGGHLLLPLPDRNATAPDKGLLSLLETERQRLGHRTKWQFLADPAYRPRKPL